MSYSIIILQVEVIVHSYILHDLCMPAATLLNSAIFSEESVHKVCLFVFVCVV